MDPIVEVLSRLDRLAWARVLVGTACLIYWSDALVALFTGQRRPDPDDEAEPPVRGSADLADDLASSDPARIVAATRRLRLSHSAVAVPCLAGLLEHPDPDVALRAACVLYERQDPEAFPPLFSYMSRRTARRIVRE